MIMRDFNTPENTINCPQCGASLPLYFAYAKLTQCEFCNTTLFLDDASARVAGDSSILTPQPSLIKLNQPFSYNRKNYFPMGMIRYSYGRGFWEEWWIKDNSNNEYWLSVDEGDMVLQRAIENEEDPSIFKDTFIGQKVGSKWIISEIGTGVCEGFIGLLPKTITIGQKHKYLHLSGYHAQLKTLEVDPSGMHTYIGKWLNPFEIAEAL